MSTLSQQMQGAMNQSLKTARIDTMIKNAKGAMIDAANRIEKRPSLKGCDALEKTSGHSLIKANKDDSGFQMMGMALGGGSALEVAADIAVDTYSNRRATQIRPQDERELSPKEEARIRQDNMNDLKKFFSVAEQLETLELLKDTCDNDQISPNSNGYWNAIINTDKNDIVGVQFEETGMQPSLKKSMPAVDKMKAECEALQFSQSPKMKYTPQYA